MSLEPLAIARLIESGTTTATVDAHADRRRRAVAATAAHYRRVNRQMVRRALRIRLAAALTRLARAVEPAPAPCSPSPSPM